MFNVEHKVGDQFLTYMFSIFKTFFKKDFFLLTCWQVVLNNGDINMKLDSLLLNILLELILKIVI